MSTPEIYNRQKMEVGALTWEHITEMARSFQRMRNMEADGKIGPMTRAAIEHEASLRRELTVADGWVDGDRVRRICAHTSWYYSEQIMEPAGIMAHYTATDGGAENMARRRQAPRQAGARAASWHFTIVRDGELIQMVPCDRGAWHCGKGEIMSADGQRRPINRAVIGVEFIGHGKRFTPEQISTAGRLWRALVRHYGIARDKAMLQHSEYDPTRRQDPGKVFIGQHAPEILAAAYRS